MTSFKLESNRDNQFYLKLIEMIIETVINSV